MDYIDGELEAGHMCGPLPSPFKDVVYCSPTGLVPKGKNSGQWQMIVDLSYPNGRNVNDGIVRAPCSLKYASVDDALQFIIPLTANLLSNDNKLKITAI